MEQENDFWKSSFQANFDFKKFQSYRIDVCLDKKASIGSIYFSLGELLQKETQVKENSYYSIQLQSQLLQQGNLVYQHWAGVKLLNTDGLFGRSDPFLQFHQWDGEQWNQIHQTEYIESNLNPTWMPFQLEMGLMNFQDESKNFKIECWDHSKKNPPKHKFIGSLEISISDIMASQSKTFELYNHNHASCGSLKLLSFKINQNRNFLSQIAKTQIQTNIFFEFTQNSIKLHHMSHQQLNIFQQVLTLIGSQLFQYNQTNSGKLFGFGGTYQQTLKDYFEISKDSNGIQEICADYTKTKKEIEFGTKVQLTPALFEIVKQSELFKPNFTVGLLLILEEIADAEKLKLFLSHQLILPTIMIIITLKENAYQLSSIIKNQNNMNKVRLCSMKEDDKNSIQILREEIFTIIEQEIREFYNVNI
ncbi:unnamed protein product (macronuclear) [Paramecium tetraurelia]|uniref:C2 domain-containing protein n=1 Tax=Paramecium tetraurelia TaxID=5888 RepID=A0EBE1_PARTE|nr:uncharacterized protein GSPATT00025342001 [Paramecium tetraurelia]CAK92608.1 unnamed protein product [Paramecium tetraurelia]|eukprot:XP_001460005.1 hypothetical protein (macronuclear) [Paramecium tetraurelia strain d4-2]